MKRAARFKRGSVVFDKRRKTWNFLWWEKGKRRSKLIGTREEYPTKSAAWSGAEDKKNESKTRTASGPSVCTVIEGYRSRKMPKRFDTRRSYESRLKNHIVPRWGHCSILELQAMPVEDWINSLDLASRTKGAIRALIHALWKYAIWARMVDVEKNPIDEVSIEGSSLREKSFQSLTVEEGRAFLEHLSRQPFRSIALVCLCLGLRISECLALHWCDVDWISRKLRISRSIVRQHVDKPKTKHSRKPLPIDAGMISILQQWRQTADFKADSDWIFASPSKLGRLPWSDDQVRREFRKAAQRAGIKFDPEAIFGTHSMRNSFRSWLDAAGASLSVQRKLLRHADIRTTMNIYGDVVTDEMAKAQSEVTAMALNGSQADRKSS